MKKFLSTLLIGAFVFGICAVDMSTASAYSPKKYGHGANHPGYSTKKPEQPKGHSDSRTHHNREGRTQYR